MLSKNQQVMCLFKSFMNSFFAHAGVISEAPRISEILINILQFLLSVIGIVAILALVITGIRYVTSQSTDAASGAKKSFIAIVIGLVVVLASLIAITVVGNFLS